MVLGFVWVPESVVLACFRASLSCIPFMALSNASFAMLYPCSRPKFIPLSTPFLPPSAYPLFHKSSRFSPSGVNATCWMIFSISSTDARRINVRNEVRDAVSASMSSSSCEMVTGWLMLVVISAVVGCAVLVLLVAFGRFELCFLAIIAVCVRFPKSCVRCYWQETRNRETGSSGTGSRMTVDR